MVTLAKGMRGPEVAKLQQALAAEGYDVKVDGHFGDKTLKAVKAFQRSANIPADGAYGQRSSGILQPPLPRPDPSRQMPAMQPSMSGGGSGGAQAMAQMQPTSEPGNIDLNNRPTARNPDGSISTVRSISINEDGREILIPTVAPSGTVLSDEGAIALYHRTGKHLGKFPDAASANQYAEQLHKQQEQTYVPRGSSPPGIGSDPDRNVTSALDPGFRAYNGGMVAAGQSNSARPPMPMDGSALQTANSPMADGGGPMPPQPTARPQPTPDQFAAARAQLQQQMQPPQQAGPTPPTPEQMQAARQSLQQQLQPQQAPQQPQAGFQLPSFIGSANAGERPQQRPAQRLIQFEGKTLAFPGDATDDEIRQALSSQPAPNNGQDGSLSVDNAVRATARGVPGIGSFLDEANAATNATLAPIVEPFMSKGPNDISRDGASWGERYNRSLGMQRGKDQAFDEQNPVTSTGLQIAGGVASGGALLKAAPGVAKVALGMGGRTLPGQIASSAASGVGMGAISGYGEGQGNVENRLQSAGQGAAIGGAFGAAAPVVGKAVGKLVGKVVDKTPAAPSTESIKAEAQAAYKAAKSSGLVVSPESFKSRVDVLARKMADEGLDPSLHPKATAAMNRIMKANDAPLTLQDLDTLRQIAGDAAGSIEPGERRLGSMMREGIDDYLANLKPSDVIAGDAKKAANDVVRARSLWQRMRKAELIDTALEKAERGAASTGSGGNIENSQRQKIRALLDNPKTARQFTAAEKQALELVVRGGKTQNLLRLVGKLSPQGNGLMAALGIGATYANPTMAVIPAAGFAAKKGAEAMSSRNVKMAEELIRRGAPAPKAGSPLAAAYARLLTQIGGQEAVNLMPQRSMP